MPSSHKADRTKYTHSWQPMEIAAVSTPAFVEPNATSFGTTSSNGYRSEVAVQPWIPAHISKVDENLSARIKTTTDQISEPIQGCLAWQPAELDAVMRVRKNQYLSEASSWDSFTTQVQANQIVHAAEERAREILSHADTQALGVIQHAESQAVQLTHQAYSAGLSSADAETNDMLQTSRAIVEEVETWRGSVFAQGEMMMLRLVIEIAQTIFGEGLPLDPDTLGQTFSQALSQAKTLGDLRVYVHPDDAAALRPLWLQQQTAFSGQHIELASSEIIKRGGCFIEGQFGSVDARVESQMQMVKNTLLSRTVSEGSEQR